MLVPAPVLAELQGLADAADDLRRGRGRRGLEVLEALRREPGVDVEVIDDEAPGVPEVDAKLVRMCLDRDAALLTLDTNLARSRRARRRPGDEPARADAGRCGRRSSPATRSPCCSPRRARSPDRPSATSTTARWSSSSGPATASATRREVQVTSVLTTANGRMVFAKPLSIAGTRVHA